MCFVKRIFDLFLLEGENIIYTLLIKILSQLKEEILKKDEYEVIR
jgi:hypothetical protein